MKKHILNLFRISNLHDFNFSYKLINFDLRCPAGKENWYNKQLEKLTMKVASLTGGPAVALVHSSKMQIAIPADRTFENCRIDIVAGKVNLQINHEIHQILPGKIDDSNWTIAQKFMDFAIRNQLTRKYDLWKLNNSQFFPKEPTIPNAGSNISIFTGFAYKVVRLEDQQFYVVLDVTSKYIDRNCLSYYVNPENIRLIDKQFRKKKFLYLNGKDWYSTEFKGLGDQISSYEVTRDGKTSNLFDYILKTVKARRPNGTPFIKPTDITYLYTYPGRSMEPHKGSVSLARMLYPTSDPKVKALHGYSIKEPSKRMKANTEFVAKYFQDLKFNNQAVAIAETGIVESIDSFQVPDLLGNNGKIVSINNDLSKLPDYARERKALITQNGILNQEPFDDQYLIVPDYLDKALVDALCKNAEFQLKQLAPAFKPFKPIRYKVLENVAATMQIQEIEKVLIAQNALSGFALFVLPDLAFDSDKKVSRFHDILKNKFYPDLKLQCVSANKIKSFFKSSTNVGKQGLTESYKVPEDLRSKFRSYLFNLCMEHLIVNRKWPFALKNNLHYDIYIGIDVHQYHAGFTFFFKNGEHIVFMPVAVPPKAKGQRWEKLKYEIIYPMIYEQLKQLIPKYSPNPNGIIVVRDGRSFGEEDKALSDTIKSLSKDGLLNEGSIKSAVIDLHKQSMVPFRIAALTDSYEQLENPIIGAYKLFNSREGFIFNTGYPFRMKGSVKPIHLSFISGDANFLMIMEDLFCQAMLAFSAPDRSNALPVIIKLIDTLLEPLTSKAKLDNNSVDEEEEDEEIEEEAVTVDIN